MLGIVLLVDAAAGARCLAVGAGRDVPRAVVGRDIGRDIAGVPTVGRVPGVVGDRAIGRVL